MLASHPSLSIETETTHRIEPPSRPAFPTVFITSRSRSLVGEMPGLAPVAGALDDLAAEALDLVRGHLAEARVQQLPDSSCSLSMSRVFGRGNGAPPSSKFRNSGSRPCTRTGAPPPCPFLSPSPFPSPPPSSFPRWNPET